MRQSWSLALLGATMVFLAGCHGAEDGTDEKRPFQVSDAIVNPAGFGSLTPQPSPSPGPSPTPAPTPEPTPSQNPVARVTIKVMFVVCNNQSVPNSEGMTNVPVGCKIHLDLNAKDADNHPTDGSGNPQWHYSDEDLVDVHEDTFTPVLVVRQEGTLRVTATLDGVQSNELVFTFYR